MKVKLMNKGKNSIKFEVDGTNPIFVSMIRRTILNKVPVMAIDEVDMHKNTSALYNDNLAHRLGLIPLTFESGVYNPKEECKCKGKGCTKCEVVLVLGKKGPCTIYAKDLKSTNPKVVPVDKDIVIVKLLEDQEVKLEAIARINNGKKHSRWQSAIVGYEYGKDDSKIKVTVESISGMEPKKIVLEAVDILDKELKELNKLVK